LVALANIEPPDDSLESCAKGLMFADWLVRAGGDPKRSTMLRPNLR
jgi:hypothetical protein